MDGHKDRRDLLIMCQIHEICAKNAQKRASSYIKGKSKFVPVLTYLAP
jgi:hypothetical protein